MKLAREFRRPDWRSMLAGMSSSELTEWGLFYGSQHFQSDQLDIHFSKLSHLIFSVAYKDHDLMPCHFSVLNPPETTDEPGDETLMSLAESIGGVRYGPVSG